VHTKSPVTAIEHGQTGVKVTCRVDGRSVVHEADHLVCAVSAFMLRNIPITPALPPDKVWAIANVPYYHDTRPIFQTRTKFWEKDALTPTMEFNVPELNHVWATCEEVETPRGLIVGTATGPQTPERALAAYTKLYPGKGMDVEKARAVVWATNPWASACETTAYDPGALKKFWPALIEPHGRLQFCGAYADNLNWGQEAATRSAYRVAEAIDKA
jgi:monoamine oxidase